MACTLRCSLVLLLALLLAAPLRAYNGFVATAGPVTVRINPPSIGSYGAGGAVALDQTEAPFTVVVSLSNAAAYAIHGTLRAGVIGPWRVEPANAVPFEVAAKGRIRVEFTVTVGQGAYHAHYPIHARAEFDDRGAKRKAHAVLILATQLPSPPRAVLPDVWKPVALLNNSAIGLWHLPVHREWFQASNNGRVISAPAAQSSVVSPVRVQGANAVVALGPRSPSLMEVVTDGTIEYPLRLPKAERITLTFGWSSPPGCTAAWRVKVAPFEPQQAAAAVVADSRTLNGNIPGHPATSRHGGSGVNLSQFAGQDIRLQLEAESAGCSGAATWRAPRVIAGDPPPEHTLPSTAPASWPVTGDAPRALGPITQAGERYDVGVWLGRRGLLDAAVGFTKGQSRLLFRGFRVHLLDDELEDSAAASQLLETREEPRASAPGRCRVRHRFTSWAGDFDLLGELWVERDALRARWWLENAPAPRPWLDIHIEQVSAGPWSERLDRVYAGDGNVIEKPERLSLGFDGHNVSTSFVGFDFANGMSLLEGVLGSIPDRLSVDATQSYASLAAPHTPTLLFVPTSNVFDAVKTWRLAFDAPAGRSVHKLAGRFVFDLWSGRYAESAAALRRAFLYGLTDAAVVWHNWQRWGYDYRLPDLYPPNPDYGTFDEFLDLRNACRQAGVLFAPHDNYIDFYPDSEGFTYDNIVFQRDRSPQKAWYHAAREAQSYRSRPDRVQPFVERNVRLMREGFFPDAYFIDVWTSIAPYDYWTSDGAFVMREKTREAWASVFDWIRDYLGGAPQISEAGHDQLMGAVDGMQANQLRVEKPGTPYPFTWKIAAADAERIPWFDAAYHDRAVKHGAGYPDRYAGGLDPRTHGIYSDDYMATEVLDGHPAMVSLPFGRDVVRKYWLLHDVMAALALKPMQSHDFDGGDIHRQHVKWAGGGEAWVNRGEKDWEAAGRLLPQYGFYARVPTGAAVVEAAIERRAGIIVEWAKSAETVYYNARPIVREAARPASGDEEDDEPQPAPGADPRLPRMNPGGRVVAFDAADTNGAFRLERVKQGLRVLPLPESEAFVITLDRLPWNTPRPHEIVALDETGKALSHEAIGVDSGAIRITIQPRVFEYRLR